VLYFRLLDYHGNCGLPVAYVSCPIGISESSKALSDGFVETIGRDLDSVLDAIDIATRHSTSAEGHTKEVPYSLSVRQSGLFGSPYFLPDDASAILKSR
jgi:hypothetical protein